MLSIDEKIQAQQEAVDKAKAKYDAAVEKLKELKKKKEEKEQEELMEAISASNKTAEEIMAFLKS